MPGWNRLKGLLSLQVKSLLPPFFFRSTDAREKQTLFKLGSTGPSSNTGKLLREAEEGGAVGSSLWSRDWETNSTSEQKAGPRRENLKGLDSTLSKREPSCVSKTGGKTLKCETCSLNVSKTWNAYQSNKLGNNCISKQTLK